MFPRCALRFAVLLALTLWAGAARAAFDPFANPSVGATGATAPSSATLFGGEYLTGLPTYSTNGYQAPLTLDTNGRLLADILCSTASSATGAGSPCFPADNSTFTAGASLTAALGGAVEALNSAATAGTAGDQAAAALSTSRALFALQGVSTLTGTAWASGTTSGTTQVLSAVSGAPGLLVQLDQGSGISAGAVTFQVTYDGANWVTIPANDVINPSTGALISLPYTLVASTNQPFVLLTNGAQGVRLEVSTTTAGGSVTPYVATLWGPAETYTSIAQGGNVATVGANGLAVALPSGTVGGAATIPGGTNTIGKIDVLGNGGGTLDTAAGTAASTGLTVQGFGAAGSPSGDIVTVQTAAAGSDACQSQTHSFKPFSFSSTTAQLMVTGTSGKKTYVCSLMFAPIATATNVAVIEGTTTTNPCDTGTAGVIGGTTTSTGLVLAANEGDNIGTGSAAVAATATNADNLCLLASAANQISGVLVTAQQ